MSNRNFDNSVITRRRQDKTYANNLYVNTINGRRINGNPQNSNWTASEYNNYYNGAQTMYSRGLGVCETIDIGGTCVIVAAGQNIIPPSPFSDYGWITYVGDNTNQNYGYSITVDSQRNVYVTGDFGDFSGSTTTNIYNYITISSGIVSTSLFGQLYGSGFTDAFIVKYNSSGQAQWATNIGGTTTDGGRGIIIDSQNNLYVTGNFTISSLINSYYSTLGDSTISTTQLGQLVGSNAQDAFIVKYNSSGQAQWATSIGGTGTDQGLGIAIDENANIYATGYFTRSSFINSYYSTLGSGTISTTRFGRLIGTGINNFTDAFIVKYNSSGQAQWAINIGGTSADQGRGIATDLNANIYAIGYFTRSTFFNSYYSTLGSGIISTTRFGQLIATGINNFNDAYIVKYNSAGQAQWATNIGGTSVDQGFGIATDLNANIYATGFFTTSSFINNYYSTLGSGIISTTKFGQLVGSGSQDAFIVKYNSSGQAQWATNIGGTSADQGLGITTDINANIYATGFFNNSTFINNYYSTLGSGIISTTQFGQLVGSGFQDAFIVKYNSSGQAQWATNIGGTGADQGYGITTDIFGNIYNTGIFNNNPFFNQFSSIVLIFTGVQVLTTTTGQLIGSNSTNTYVVQYNSSGQAKWATKVDGTLDDLGQGIVNDIQNNLYLTGQYNNSTTVYDFVGLSSNIVSTTVFGQLIGIGGQDALIVKYNSSGHAQWATNIGGTGSDIGNSITADSQSNIYLTGAFTSTAKINNYVSTVSGVISTTLFGELVGSVNQDAFIAKYNSSGQAQWITNIGGSGIDQGRGVTLDSQNNVYVTGYFTGSTTIYDYVSSIANSSISTTIFGQIIGTGSEEAFLVKYNSSGQTQWATVIGGISTQQGFSVATDSQNNVYITGYYRNSTTIYDYESLIGSPPVVSTSAYGILTTADNNFRNCFIVKYNSSGKTQWATKLGCSTFIPDYDDEGRSITIDTNNNVYVTGYYRSNDVSPYSFVTGGGGGEITLSEFGKLNAIPVINASFFIAKYTSSGQAQWITDINGTNADQGLGITTDSFNNIYATGYFTTTANINDFVTVSSGIVSTSLFGQLNNSGEDAIVVKYNSSGQAQWATNIGASGSDQGLGITTNLINTVTATGFFTSSCVIKDFLGLQDVYEPFIITSTVGQIIATSGAYIVKYNSSGQIAV